MTDDAAKIELDPVLRKCAQAEVEVFRRRLGKDFDRVVRNSNIYHDLYKISGWPLKVELVKAEEEKAISEAEGDGKRSAGLPWNASSSSSSSSSRKAGRRPTIH